MSISNWFQNWLTARKAEQRAAAPDHSVRLFVRCLEDRQVLSVSAVLVGTDVTFLGDDGGVSADSIVFTVDIDGNLEHNLGGTNGFHSNLDLDNTVAGDQILAVDDITQLSIDLGADSDSVDFADHFDFASGGLSVSAESISATLGSLSVQGLARFDAGSANSLSFLGVNDFHQIQIVSANNVFLNDINDLEFSGASVISGDLEVTFRSLVTDQITNSAGASLSVGDLASFSGGSISLGDAIGDTIHFGRLHLDAVGTASVEEDSATQLFGDVFASELRLVSAGDITDTTGAIQISGLASFSGTAISLGGALTDTNFGSLNFSSTGAVAVQEDSATELAGDNDALSLQIDSTGDLTDTSTSLTVSDLAQFEGTSITLGGATSTTELGRLAFSTPGDVSIQVDAATQLAGDNSALSLVLDSAGAISDSSNSLNVTNHAELSGSSVAIGGAGTTTNFGSLSFHSTGTVTVQEDSSTQVNAASTAGSLDLQSTGQVQLDATVTVTNGASITADGAITVSATLSSGGTTSLTSQHEVTVDAVIEGSTVTIEAGDDIAVHARIEAVDAIELTAGTDGSGSVETALAGDLIASNVSSTATIQIASGATSGAVLLTGATTADSLVRITSASEINGPGQITGGEIELFAATGIGTLAALRLSGATITAQSTQGNIDLGNAVAATYAQVSTGTGTIAIFNTGAAVFTSVTTTDGAIHLVAVDGDLTVGTNVTAGGGDADDDVTLLNTSGNIVLNGTTSASGNEVLAISDGSISGAGLVSADDVDLQAETGITANLAAENIRVTTTSGGVQLSNTAISPQTTLDLTTGGDAEVHNSGALSIVGTVDGNLTVTVDADDLTDSGPLSVTGTSSLSAAGDVILDHASNDFGGAVAVAGQTVELIDTNSLTLGQIDAVTVQVTASGPLTLGTGAGEDLVATDCVQLHANSGGVVQRAGSAILTDRLALTGSGAFTLEQANDVAVLAVDIDGSIHFSDSNALIVGTACGVSGLATSGQDARLSTGGNLTIGEAGDLGANDVSLGTGDLTLDVTGSITQLTGNTITATGLQLLGSGGPAQLSESNTVATLAADRDGTIEFTNSAALTVGTVTDTAGTLAASTSGVTTSGDDVRLTVLGDLLIDEAISLGAGSLSLNVTGTISQNAGDTITAAGLSLSGSGAGSGAVLGEANDIDTFASEYQGLLLLSDIDDLTVGAVTAVGVTTTGISTTFDTKLTTGVDLHLAEAVDLGPGNLLLDVNGAVTQSASGTIQAAGLALLVTGTTTLDQANDVDTVAADTQGAVQLTDIDDLTVGSVTCGSTTVAGVSTTFDVKLVTGGDLHLAEAVQVGPGNLLLDVDGAVTQSATGTIQAVGLALIVSGPTTLDLANDVDTLAADTQGSVLLNDVDDLTVGSVTCGSTTVAGISTTVDVKLVTGGNLHLTEAVDLGPGNLLLHVDGSVTQSATGTITAAGLALMVTGSTTLDQTNDVDTLAADTQGSVLFNDVDDLTVGSVTSFGMTVIGILTTFDTKLVTGGNLTLTEAVNVGPGNVLMDVDGAITQTASGTIQAGGLALLVTGNTTLDQANDVDRVAADTQGSVLFHDVDDLTVGTVTCGSTSVVGISTTLDTKLIAGGDLHVAERIDLGPGNLLLDVDGAVTQSATGTITATGLALRVTGSTTLDQANDVDTLAADTQGSIQLRDVDDLIVGSVTCGSVTITGVSTNFDTKLITGGNLHLAEAIDLGPGNLFLDVDGSVTQSATGTITAAGLALMVTGSTALNQANDVDTLAAETDGTLLFNDVDDLTVGSVTSLGTTVTGITSTLDAKLVTGGDLHLAEAVDLGSGNLFLDVDGTVTQTATGTITASGLALMVSGTTTLNQTNDVDTLAADTQGSVEFHDVDDLHIGIVNENASPANMSITGVTVDDADFTVSVGTGNLTLDQAISTGAGDVRLEATTGSILDGQDGLTRISAHNLSLTAQTQIGDIVDFAAGTGEAIDVSLTGRLTQASVTDAGGEISLNFHGDLRAASGSVNVGEANAASAILRATGGDIDVGTAIGVFSLSSGDNLALEAIEVAGAGGTLVLPDAGLDVGVGDLRLRGDVDVRDAMDRNLGLLVADDLHFTSGAGSGDTTLTTRINTLTAQITGSGAGLTVLEADGLVLTDIDLVDGDLAVHASQTAAGDIQVIDVSVGDARITLDTTAHGGGQIVDADPLDDPNTADLTATEINLRAGTGIANGAKLEIAADRLAATTVSGQINVRDVAGDLTIAALTGGTTGVSVTAGVAGDDICVSTVGALTVDAEVSNAGTGDREILLAADGDTTDHDLTVNADITATGGNSSITLLAGDSILFAGTTVTSAAGTGAVQARAGRVFQNGGVESAGSASGDILMSDGSIIQSDNGTITLSAPNDIQLSMVNSNVAGVDGDIVLTADADGSSTGQIREVLSGELANLIADHVTLSAATGIGAAGAGDIDSTIASIEATNTTSGSIFIHETDALAITGAGLQTLAGNGDVHVTVDAGPLTVDSVVTAHGSGDVTLIATSGAAELNAEIRSTTGNIQVAVDTVGQNSDITTGGAGTIQVVADTGSVTMADGTQATTELGSIDYSAVGNIALSLIRSDSGPISITADSDNSLDGAIIDNTASETANLATDGTLTLLAATGIGTSDDLNTDIGLLIATNRTSGDIAIREADGLIVTGSGVRTLGGNGNISLVVDDGALVVNSLIAAHGSGSVTLEATQGPAELNAAVSSTSGNLTITANAVNQNTGGDLETGSNGTIEVTADAGSITMADGTTATTSAGNILYSATADVRLSHLSSRSGDLTVRAGHGPSGAGAIIDNTADELPNLRTSGSATLIAETGIGAGDDIDTAVSRLDVTNSTSGAIQITEVDAVQIVQLSQAGGGNVFVQTTNGSITVDNANVTPHAITVSGGGSLVLDANGAGANVIVNDGIKSIGGDIALVADRSIETNSAAVATTGGDGDLTFVAGRDIRVLDPGNLNPIDLQVTGSGTVSLRAANELVLGSQDPRDPNPVQHTTLNDVVVASETGRITNTLPILFDVRSPQITSEGEAVLSVTIGRPGETNLAVRVYWGDGTVETFTGLTAGTYTYRHFYTKNPDPLDPAAPILVNVQVAHDPKILLFAPNVNSSVLSVRNSAVDVPPPVPTPNINADLAKAIYNSGDPLFATLQAQIVSSPGSEAAPGTVVFQDTTFLATTIPVPGEGLATFVFDTTPPVVLLTIPEGVKIVDTQPASTVQVSEGNSALLVAEAGDDTTSGERQVILEVISPTGEVIQQAVLPESTLDDLQAIIGRLPDGQYRFQLREAGEDRLRLLLEFEVRQGKIADETDAADRPPSTKKPAAEPMDPETEEEASDPNEARLLLPEHPDDDNSAHSPATHQPTLAVSMAVRRAWKQAAEVISRDNPLDETDPAGQSAQDDSATPVAAWGVMVAVVGAGLAVPVRSRSQQPLRPQLSRVSRLLRRVRSAASGQSTATRQPDENELAMPLVLPLGEWTSC